MQKKLYRSKYEAYPFLCDQPEDLRCDFEILTDEIACQIGLLHALVKNEALQAELLTLCELVYHLNPSLRTFVTVTQAELAWLEECTKRLQKETKDSFFKFVLNQGCESACHAHIIRSKCKSLVRMLYQHLQQGHAVPDILLDFANLLSGYFFHLALKLNQLAGIAEIEFISRNY
ncbi:MAG: ATP--cob(I)alamin adenosyltransferase [Clostridia bacterium]